MKDSEDNNIVNKILAEWNPIGVPDGIAVYEYTDYVPNILRLHNDMDGLVKEMERIVTDVMGLGYDRNNIDNRHDILTFAKKIIDALRSIELISFNELCSAIESDKSDSKIKATAQFFLNSINDWPTYNLKEPVDFMNELKKKIGFPLTFELIENYEKKLSLDKEKNTWKKEALSSVLEMFYWNKSNTLDDIVKEISQHYKTKE